MSKTILPVLRPPRFLIVLLGALFLIVLNPASGAQADPLGDGVGFLNNFRKPDDPKHKATQFIDKIVKEKLPARGPSDAMTPVTPDTNPDVLQDADNLFVKNPDGSVSYISKQRLKEGLQEMANRLSKDPELDKLWDEAKKIAPAKVLSEMELRDKTAKIPFINLGVPSRAKVIRDKALGPIMEALGEISDENKKAASKTIGKVSPNPKPVANPFPAPAPVPIVKVPGCGAEKAQVAAAQQDIAAGQLGAAEATLRGVDLAKCPALAGTVNGARASISNTVNDLNARAGAASTSCDAAAIDQVATELGGISHPGLTMDPADLRSRALTLADAQGEFDRANANVKSGQWSTALGQLNSLRSIMEIVGFQGCPPYDRAGRGVQTINDRITRRVGQANAAANSCKMEAIDKLLRHLSRINHPRIRVVLARLEAAKERCRKPEQQTAELTPADQRCIDQHGSSSYSKESGADGINICGCRDPYIFNFDGTRCVRPDQVMADANVSCQESFGPGSYANANQSSYKTYVCECGSGTTWNCGKRRCVKTAEFMSALRTHATEICQGRFGSALRRVQVSPSCKYSCVIAQRTVRRTPTRRRTPGQRAPTRTHDKGLSVIIGVIGVISQIPQSSPSSTTNCSANPLAPNC